MVMNLYVLRIAFKCDFKYPPGSRAGVKDTFVDAFKGRSIYSLLSCISVTLL